MENSNELTNALENAEVAMQLGVNHFSEELSKIRAGKAAPHMVDSITVDYYGANTPLNQLASVNTPDPKTIVIQPWDKAAIENIEKAIIKANLGLNPQNDGNLIRINIPPLTEERRKQLVKFTKTEAEKARISIRNERKDMINTIRNAVKNGFAEDAAKIFEEQIQELTNKYTKLIDENLKVKEEEILTV